jgi:hypothetical protein
MPEVGISQRIREASVSDLASDIPPGMTLAEYGAARPRRSSVRLRVRVAAMLSPRWLK